MTGTLKQRNRLSSWVVVELDVLARRAELLAEFLRDNDNRGEAAAASNIASAIRNLARRAA